MILNIDISKEAPGIYIARAYQSRSLVTEPETYDRIEDAIREQALSVPDGFAYFLEFTYGGMSTGTMPIGDVPAQAAALAEKLVSLNAALHEASASRGKGPGTP